MSRLLLPTLSGIGAQTDKAFKLQKKKEQVKRASFSILSDDQVAALPAYDRFVYFLKKDFFREGFTAFEKFITFHIILVSIAVGMEVSLDDKSPALLAILNAVNLEALVVFTIEAVLKIVAEGAYPWRYFTNSG